MTIADHSLTEPLALLRGRRLLVRWSGTFSVQSPPIPWPDGRRPDDPRLELVIALAPVRGDHAVIEAWLEAPGYRRSVLEAQPARCDVTRDGRLLHVDASVAGRRVVSLSLDLEDDRLLFATSPLLRSAGLAPGAFDPPTLQHAVACSEAVTG
jgi:hypothetical protein